MTMCLSPGEGGQGGTYGIYGRVFLPNGTALGNGFSINQITTNNQQNPSVAGLINDNVLLPGKAL